MKKKQLYTSLATLGVTFMVVEFDVHGMYTTHDQEKASCTLQTLCEISKIASYA